MLRAVKVTHANVVNIRTNLVCLCFDLVIMLSFDQFL